MIKVEIQANTAIKGVPVYCGDILDIDDADYRILASYQLAKPYIELVEKLEEVKKEVIIEKSSKGKNKKGGKKK